MNLEKISFNLKSLKKNYNKNLHQSLLTIEHYQHDAYASFWLSRANNEHHQCDVNEWVRSKYCYLAEEFNQDKEYT